MESSGYYRQQKRLLQMERPVLKPKSTTMEKSTIDPSGHYMTIPKKEYEELMEVYKNFEGELSKRLEKPNKEIDRLFKAHEERYKTISDLRFQLNEAKNDAEKLRSKLNRIERKKWYQFWK